MITYKHLKPLLYKFPPETAHYFAEMFLKSANYCPILFNNWTNAHFIRDKMISQNIFGRGFFNPIGLAAGFDKKATMIYGAQALGFGFTEIGTITPKAQRGNSRPRMFRHIAQKSLQNAMGFNNDGLYLIEDRLRDIYPFSTPIGINLGKNKITSQDDAINDYIKLIKVLHPIGDYFVINLSSPNTPGLRDLQNEEFTHHLFTVFKEITQKPILLKIAPDMEKQAAVDLTALAVESGADGIIATNTTIDYGLIPGIKEMGGLSGEVLKEKSFEIFDAIAKELYGKTVLVSVGGISNANEAYKRIKAGASLIQLYTAIIFEGPSLVQKMNQDLITLLSKDGYSHISEAIGASRK